jgi:Zn-dependent protease
VLAFRLFSIPVTVRLSFLLVATFLGLSLGRVPYVVAWVVVVAFSILIHELGHAFTARSFGAEVEIELIALGGLTSWSIPEGELSPGRRASIAAAGSAVGVVFGGLVWLVESYIGPVAGLGGFVIDTLIRVNLFWGVLNWLPVRPLDGGHLFVSLLEKVAPRRAQSISNAVFLVTAAVGLAAALYFRLIFAALLAGFLLYAELTRNRVRQPPVAIPPMSFDRPEEGTEPDAGAEPEIDQEPEREEADG